MSSALSRAHPAPGIGENTGVFGTGLPGRCILSIEGLLKIGSFAALLLFAGQPALAGVGEGVAAVQAGDYDVAEHAFQSAAADGDPEGWYHLGALRHAGMGHAADPGAAAHLYLKAANAGVPEAQLALGTLFYTGNGVTQDLYKALQLYTDAAEAGLPAAQFNLAMMHAAGEAHATDYGAQEDLARAFKWFQVLLARLEDPDIREMVAQNVAFIRPHMSQAEVEEGRQMADEWLAAHPQETAQ